MIEAKENSAMKGFGTLLIVLGIVCAIAGIFGFIQLSNNGMSGDLFDAGLGLGSMFGTTSYLSSEDRFLLEIIKNRTVLLIGGLIVAVLGGVMRRSRRS